MATAKRERTRKTTNTKAKTHLEPTASENKATESAGEDASEAIRRRAYELYQERGGRPGAELEDWLRAEKEILETKRIA